ncbi:hypothetical protein D3C80_2174390 [compost metagenome]
MGGGGEQQQVTLWVVGQGAQQTIALMFTATNAFGTGMCFVDDHQLWTRVLELVAASV